MSTTTGLSLEQLQAKRKELISQGKELSTSKELGKIENAIKVLNPSKYDSKQVASAQKSLNQINKPSISSPTSVAQTTSGVVSGTSDLEKQLAAKQDALTKATKNINDNPWYSEATRVGKLAKLNNIAQIDIANLQSQITQQKTDAQRAFENNITTQNLALNQQKANQPNTSTTYQTDNNGNVTL